MSNSLMHHTISLRLTRGTSPQSMGEIDERRFAAKADNWRPTFFTSPAVDTSAAVEAPAVDAAGIGAAGIGALERAQTFRVSGGFQSPN